MTGVIVKKQTRIERTRSYPTMNCYDNTSSINVEFLDSPPNLIDSSVIQSKRYIERKCLQHRAGLNKGLLFQSITSLLILALLPYSLGFSVAPSNSPIHSSTGLKMGFFDGISKAFGNQDFKESDQRVRASHILIKGDMDIETIDELMGEINERTEKEPERKFQIFAEVARRESQCPSATQGGDLGLFGPGKMVREFDMVLFPDAPDRTPPPVGAMVGPIPTEFGCHVILVTNREVNNDQVTELLANLAE